VCSVAFLLVDFFKSSSPLSVTELLIPRNLSPYSSSVAHRVVKDWNSLFKTLMVFAPSCTLCSNFNCFAIFLKSRGSEIVYVLQHEQPR
jgi:hypothetical protein